MSIRNELLTFYIDDHKFSLAKSLINNYPESHLLKIINGTIKDKYVMVDKNDVYVNKDPEVFIYIIDVLRGYDFVIDNIKDHRLKCKLDNDLKYFGLYHTITKPTTESIIESKKDVMNINNLENMLNNINEEYQEEPPLIKTLLNIAKKNIPKVEQKIEQNVNNAKTEMLSELATGINTNLLNSNDQNKINEFITSVDNQLYGGNSMGIIQALSNDENIKNMLNMYNNKVDDDSDVGSLGFNDSDCEIAEITETVENKFTSELITDISNQTIVDVEPEIESLESILQITPKNPNKISHFNQISNEIKQLNNNYDKIKTRYVQIN